jgi:serine/threonine protein kinase
VCRDLKPQNLLVSRTLDRLKICDFGLSKPFMVPVDFDEAIQDMDEEAKDEREGVMERGGLPKPPVDGAANVAYDYSSLSPVVRV